MEKTYKITIAVLVGFILGVCWVGVASAKQPPGFGSVQDNNNGTTGQVLVNSGNDHGNSDIGTWVDSSFLKGEKGDTGRRGAKGDQGIQGEKGERGNRGYIGKTGKDGKDGIDGVDGKDGVKGDRGKRGKIGKKGKDGVDGEKGNKGDKGDRGKDVDKKTVNDLNNRLNKLEEPQFYFVPQVRLIDTKKWEVKPYSKFDVQDSFKFKEAGLKVTFKFGKSHEEKLIEELTEKVSKIEAFVSGEEVNNLTYAQDNYKIKMNENGTFTVTNK